MDIILYMCNFSATSWCFLQVGLGTDFWINVLLTLLGYIPGVVHAVDII